MELPSRVYCFLKSWLRRGGINEVYGEEAYGRKTCDS